MKFSDQRWRRLLSLSISAILNDPVNLMTFRGTLFLTIFVLGLRPVIRDIKMDFHPAVSKPVKFRIVGG